MNSLKDISLKPNCIISIDEIPNRTICFLPDKNNKLRKVPSFYDKDNITGEVDINLSTKSFDHNGIKIELIGIINKKSDSIKFITLTEELSSPGTLTNQVNKYKYAFKNVQLKYESFEFNVKYILRVIIDTNVESLTWESEFGVICPDENEFLKENNESYEIDIKIYKNMPFSCIPRIEGNYPDISFDQNGKK